MTSQDRDERDAPFLASNNSTRLCSASPSCANERTQNAVMASPHCRRTDGNSDLDAGRARRVMALASPAHHGRQRTHSIPNPPRRSSCWKEEKRHSPTFVADTGGTPANKDTSVTRTKTRTLINSMLGPPLGSPRAAEDWKGDGERGG